MKIRLLAATPALAMREPERAPGVTPGDIKAWRVRAEELRATADQFAVPSVQDALRRIADSYDRLADQAEALLAGGRRPGEEPC
jgi:hypothetical protein